MLPRGKRLSKEREIKTVLSKRKHEHKTPLLYVVGLENSLKTSRLCVAVSKKIGNAVVRNRTRRKFARAFLNISHNNSKKCYDFVIYPRVAAATKSLSEIGQALSSAFVKIG